MDIIAKRNFICMFNQLGKYQVKDMNVYIESLIDELLKLWAGVTMYDISRPIGQSIRENLRSKMGLKRTKMYYKNQPITF